ncbi:MAG: TetR/AcrR family transcriptional regulator [Alteromonadaceae bacterium]|nr:TetR/AcrR family transcriptional regulator [Alteromonadaceae bacterium]
MNYSRQESVEKAMTVFWQKGYAGTGMRDIQTALDKRPGSIYAAFGNKEGLYLAALEAYTEDLAATLKECTLADSPLHALKSFLHSTLGQTDALTYKRQCFIFKAQADWLALPAGIQSALRQSLQQLRGRFEDIVKAAQQHGELAEDIVPEQAALWLQGQFIAIRTLSTAIENESALEWMLDKVFNDLGKH